MKLFKALETPDTFKKDKKISHISSKSEGSYTIQSLIE